MITIRTSEERGKVQLPWLDSKHTFSFGSYYDPNHMGFASLRVINEDIIAPSKGFLPHSHQDMEIVTYVLSGSLEHKDSLGNGSVMSYGDVQRMTAGTGITHSEFNASNEDEVHLLQIWLIPGERGLKPSYEQKFIPQEEKRGKLCLIGSPQGEGYAITIHQDVYLYASILTEGEKVNHSFDSQRKVWIHVVKGEVEIMGKSLKTGDAIALSSEDMAITEGKEVEIKGIGEDSEILLFDMGIN